MYIEENLPDNIATHIKKDNGLMLMESLLADECDVIAMPRYSESEYTLPETIKKFKKINLNFRFNGYKRRRTK